jgi:D-alanyl-D-alanine carboxypeptidase/D-alanyl-D-alanine-endopeptidase (penicillin-binding protein 4)
MTTAMKCFAFAPLLCLSLLVGCASKYRGEDPALGAALEKALSAHDGKARFTARVIELPSRRELYAHNCDAPFIPASNGKIFTSSTGLDRFGPNHTFKTYLAMDGDDLWVIGTGDPAVGDEPIAKSYKQKMCTIFDDWAAELKKRGVTSIKGKLIYYQGALDREWVHPSWSRGFLADWYAAPVTGLNFNANCVDITVFPTKPGEPARYEVMPPVKNVKVINKCMTATAAATRASTQPDHAATQSASGDEPSTTPVASSAASRPARSRGRGSRSSATTQALGPPDIERAADSNTYTLSGYCTEKKVLSSKAVIDPGAFFADAMRTNFESNGIIIAGPSVESRSPLGGKLTPPSEKLIATHETKMSDVMWRINKSSQNLFAEALSKLNGQDYLASQGKEFTPGSWKDGSAAAHHFLQSNGIRDSEITLVDGSGLSRLNRVTSHAITDIFAHLYDTPNFNAFYVSMGIAGKDGTIAKRMYDLGDRIHAKTGYIGGVRSLSGYATTLDGRTLAFSFIFNDIPGEVKPYEALQDSACRILVNGPGASHAATKAAR